MDIILPTPEGMTDTQHIKKIMEGAKAYLKAEDGLRDWEAYPELDDYEGNCNTICSSLLRRGGTSLSDIEDLNPSGANPGLGETQPEMME